MFIIKHKLDRGWMGFAGDDDGGSSSDTGSESNMDDDSNTGGSFDSSGNFSAAGSDHGTSAAAEAANTPGGYSVSTNDDGYDSYSTDIGTFNDQGDGYTFDGRQLEDAFPNTRRDPHKAVDRNRAIAHEQSVREAAWDAADTGGEKTDYFGGFVDRNALSIGAGLLTMGASLPVSLGTGAIARYGDAKRAGHTDDAAVSLATSGIGDAVAGRVGSRIGSQVGYDVAGPTGAVAGGLLGGGLAKNAFAEGPENPATTTTTADITGLDLGGSSADETLSRLPATAAKTPPEEDLYATGGYGGHRNRQIRSRLGGSRIRRG